jgi:hypothetical protein
MRRTNLRLLLALAPVLLLGTIAVALSENIKPVDWRFLLLFIAVGSVAAASWRVGAAALGGTITRAHGVPHRLSLVARSERRHPLANHETGLHTDWYFRLRVEEEIARARRYGQPFTIVSIKTHTAAEMTAIGLTLAEELRQTDFAGDLGHLVAACLPNTTRSSAWSLVSRLTEVMRGVELRLSEFPEDGETLAGLLDDTRMGSMKDFVA